MRHRGDVPRPRVRFEDTPGTLVPLLKGLSGGTEEFGSSEDVIHPPDYDLLVTFDVEDPAERRGRRWESNFHILAFGATYFRFDDRRRTVTGVYAGTSVAREVVVPHAAAQVYPVFARLASETVVDNLPDEKTHWRLRSDPVPFEHPRESVQLIHLVEVGTDQHDRPVAIWHRAEDGTLTLLLPPETTDHQRWLVSLLRHLREHDPERFPGDPDWQRQPGWAPPGLADALEERAALERERQKLVAELDARAAQIDAKVERLAVEAANGVQRLLTAQGDDLVQAVADVLTDIGFDVEDRDATIGGSAPKLEDLRLKDPDEPDWVCLVEVKGYTKGAKANDVQQIALRPAQAFVEETGRTADRLWHVVNVWIESNPDTRGPSLQNDPSIDGLASVRGAFIDTRELFRAWQEVQREPSSKSTVRARLRGAVGRFVF